MPDPKHTFTIRTPSGDTLIATANLVQLHDEIRWRGVVTNADEEIIVSTLATYDNPRDAAAIAVSMALRVS